MSIAFRTVICFACCMWLHGVFAMELTRDSVRLEERNGTYYVVHQVEQHETMYSLAKRYQSTVDGIASSNELRNGGIDLGQFILIPVVVSEVTPEPSEPVPVTSDRKKHIVEPTETIYRLTKLYQVSAEDIKRWNGLTSDDLDIGMVLWVGPEASEPQVSDEETPKDNPEESEPESIPEETLPDADLPEDSLIVAPEYAVHVVQAGETLSSLSRLYNTSLDSLTYWNRLTHTSLSIGDTILIGVLKPEEALPPKTYLTTYGSKWWRVPQDSDTLIHEEGVTGVIENIIETQKLLALHRHLPVGTDLQVINLMNKRQVAVKIVGKLPDTGLNRNLMIRLTDVAYKQLGIIDQRSRVEIIYPEIE